MPDPESPPHEAFVSQAIGEWQLVGDRSWNHGGASVVQVRDASGVSWFVKRHHEPRNYYAELNAYRHVVPALGDRAPRLLASDDRLRVLLLSAVPGEVTGRSDATAMRQAGAALRDYHRAKDLPPWPWFAAAKQAKLEQWLKRGEGLLSAADVAFARARLRELDGLPTPSRVPCHLDYGPRNWLWAGDRLHVIDFEWAEPEIWVNDLAKLHFGWWSERPDLAAAFADGYGRALTDDDRELMTICHVLTMVWQLIWSHQHGNTAYRDSCRARLDQLRIGH